MIITRSPLRISLGGGGTDLPSYYREHSGFVIAAAIDKYVYITLHHTFVQELIIKYSKMERVSSVDEVQHPLIREALRVAGVAPRDIAYVNAHGTGTQQNDLVESRGIRNAFGRAADSVCVSASKSMLGHLVNASGSVELAITALALRDGFAPPTMNPYTAPRRYPFRSSASIAGFLRIRSPTTIVSLMW